MNAIDSTLYNALLASLRALPDGEQRLLEQVVREITSRAASGADPLQTESPPERVALSPWQERRAKDLMASQMDKGLSIARIASECSLSRSHFSRAFKKNTGVSPRDWFLQMRLDRARALLSESALTISQISLDCGFADQSHFTRVFTRVMGITPFNWRRANGQVLACAG
ncbi:helix-turn-helix domain-containing protein [Pseudomonas sp. UBA1879]|uniref:helix-turn-helix domain-containing protein n=1 Tax=Pseudomonas sp. UBA1879 TaxID=1947305 RepID=UPI0025D87990|nr:AraC family transcriptional regulator [Pseudomonas sp. UBA1879]